MRTNVPSNCRECECASTCNNPAPYGQYRCKYKDEIQHRAIDAVLNPKKEVESNGGR